MEMYLFEHKYPGCFICDKPVLNLIGQDIHLSWDALEEKDRNTELDIKFNMGRAHLKCLMNSKWANLIAKRKLESRMRFDKVVYSDNNLSILRNHLPKVSIIHNNGWFIELPVKCTLRETSEGILANVSTTYDIYHEWASPMPILYKELTKHFEENTKYPLLDFIEIFGVQDKLINPQSLENGTLQQLTQSNFDENGIRYPLSPVFGSLTLQANYSALIPHTIWKHIPTDLLSDRKD